MPLTLLPVNPRPELDRTQRALDHQMLVEVGHLKRSVSILSQALEQVNIDSDLRCQLQLDVATLFTNVKGFDHNLRVAIGAPLNSND